MRLLRVSALGMLLGSAASAFGQVPVSVDAHGYLQVGEGAGTRAVQFHPHDSARRHRRVAAGTDYAMITPTARSGPFVATIIHISERHGLDPELLLAMAQVESGFNPLALSSKGARGLMQVMPATAQRFGVRDLNDPEQNVLAAARYIRWLMAHFQGDLGLVLAAYNAGEGAVRRHGNRLPPYRETREYVRRVQALYHGRRPNAD